MHKIKMDFLCIFPTNSYLWTNALGTFVRKQKSKNQFFILCFAHLFVPLQGIWTQERLESRILPSVPV